MSLDYQDALARSRPGFGFSNDPATWTWRDDIAYEVAYWRETA